MNVQKPNNDDECSVKMKENSRIYQQANSPTYLL